MKLNCFLNTTHGPYNKNNTEYIIISGMPDKQWRQYTFSMIENEWDIYVFNFENWLFIIVVSQQMWLVD